MGQIDLYEDGRTKRKLEPRTVLKRLAIAIACAVLMYGGIRLYSWALPRIHYAGLDLQEWREDMEPGDYFPPVPADAKGPPESMWIRHYLTHSNNWVGEEHLREMIDRGDLLDMPGFEPGCTVSFSGGSMHTFTLIWVKDGENRDGGSMIALNASQVSGGSKYEGEGGKFIPTDSLEIARRPLITCRDGVDIVCAGGEDEEKCMRFYKDGAWYQICGDEEISYDEMVMVFDYYFKNPVYFY